MSKANQQSEDIFASQTSPAFSAGPEKQALAFDLPKTNSSRSEIENSAPDEVTLTRLNASGHIDQLQRQYSLLSICSTSVTIDCAWVAFGGSIVVGLSNGGPPGIIWELLVACIYYCFIAASIAELASSIPSAGGVYHWASVTAGRYGRVVGFFTGFINFYGWIFALSSIVFIPSNVFVEMYALFHQGTYTRQNWHVYLAFVLINVSCLLVVIFRNRWLPLIQRLGSVAVIGGGVATVVILAALPRHHASAASVFTTWDNQTGWPSGVAFLTGMLNGAYTIGTPDAITHIAEELPNPKRDLPKAIAAQMIIGTLTSFAFAVVIMFAITDLDAVLNTGTSFPLAEIYRQATGNTAATFILLFIIILAQVGCLLGTYTVAGRCWWALARDDATPFSGFFSAVSVDLSCPIRSTVFCFILCLGFGAIQLGSSTAFSDLVGSFVILTTTSYLLAIFPHLLSRLSAAGPNIGEGPFWMGPICGPVINTLAVSLILLTNTVYCFPYFLPVDKASEMNYNSAILAGLGILTVLWWFVHGREKYSGPIVPHTKETI
ncbi:choline transport protein [Lentinula lateritia]|uniref:Choline transport protein n=1 Tax=Lentinula aff. lateritia TaxID=2804960 RepID=A0ACC1TWY1_9AGAR|nr:choline transport protein [Lentinula aff. lateritia]KAJ3850589.1 choline transport protein [Lentinula lateritia]